MIGKSFFRLHCKRCNFIAIHIRMRHKLNKLSEKQPKLAEDVLKFLNSSPEYNGLKEQLPTSLLRKYKAPESSPLIEVNPGLGILTENILKCQNNKIYLFEQSNHFSPYLDDLQQKYPGRISFKIADFFGMWKLAFKDKMDDGNRIQELLGDLSTTDKNRTVKILGSMPGLSFMKHLIYNVLFHNTTNQLGRPDLFITMPVHHYEFLTDKEVQQSKQKSVPTLFQLLFDCKTLTTVTKAHFLPWTLSNSKHHSVLNEHNLYLVNITQKEKLPCPAEYLPLLWYFFKPQMFSKSTRVIPMLEQWIPGCGVWLITGQDPPDSNKLLSPGKDDASLPHMTIFTEFGDLNLQQKITVFKRFISWPEFEQCQFRITMENNLPKSVTQFEDDDKDSIPTITHIDHMDHSDTEVDSQEFDK
ncbi:dimethyladenosine transferase 2, mitochondrial isoform X2 [Bombyx mandarina]|uniref:rRNA adenine N(6)-methyltransferase n=2 Tax=Bombyx TaxID=7090 RepID=A0A8R2G8I9_BOMMO|nr:dimethyladenosine transferase 2, mitochondrial isoform X2 [Bombyx mori]XP_028033797.1 dimethyladenosine transferase 2, mitochondrial isoform X2 [Bombyx mandarina]